MGDRELPAALTALLLASAAAGQGDLAATFDRAVAARGDAYVALRTALLQDPTALRPFLSDRRAAGDWRVALQARVLRAWLDEPARCARLWAWTPPRNGFRNPFPYMRGGTRQEFRVEDGAGVPVMLELMWKKRETHLGVLPELLHEKNGGKPGSAAFRVLAEWLADPAPQPRRPAQVPLALAAYGKAAVPHLAAALRRARPWEPQSVLSALGATRDPNAVPILADWMVRSDHRFDGPAAARAVLALGSPDVLRHAYPRVTNPHTRDAILELLEQDTSVATRRFLQDVATSSPSGELRVRAFRSLRLDADAAVPVLLEVVRAERDAGIKFKMMCWISSWRQDDPTLRAAFLEMVDLPDQNLRRTAIDALSGRPHPDVTRKLLPLLTSEHRWERAIAMHALHQHEDPKISAAAVPLLGDATGQIRLWAAIAVARHPTEAAREALQSMLRTGAYGERSYAIRALVKLGGPASIAALRAARSREADEGLRRVLEHHVRNLQDGTGRAKGPR